MVTSGLENQSGGFGKQIGFLPLSEIEIRLLVCPDCSLVIVPIMLSGLYLNHGLKQIKLFKYHFKQPYEYVTLKSLTTEIPAAGN